MIDIKPPEDERELSLDLVAFMELFRIVGIEYERQGNELWIDAHYSDGKDGFIVKFYDDESFKEFDYIGMNKSDLHAISKTLKGILDKMRKRK